MAATGAPVPPNVADVEAEASEADKATTEKNQIAKGSRIFAVQYRVITKKKVRRWSLSNFQKWLKSKASDQDVQLKGFLTLTGSAMSSTDEAETVQAQSNTEVGGESYTGDYPVDNDESLSLGGYVRRESTTEGTIVMANL
ncbi:hypothetical protein BP6252_09637 [Coleophoma cylindrospora]|uniref:Uncharacterized protein n=1 Tax=Coleophoma cylindrospora TaxID=1849047 RepID=A0A3D8QW39_9HELO|nr:hypothetical protein BP6252_09637 [Coleophoma cylindrospora]